MPIIFSDNFTDTNGTVLSAHTPSVGVSWNPITNGNSGTINSNRLRTPDSYVLVAYEAVAASPIANGYVEANWFNVNSGSDNDLQLFMCFADSSNHYYVQWRMFTGFRDVRLYKRSGGVTTQLGSGYSTGTLTDSTFYTLRLTKSGAALSVQLGGATVISATDGSPLSTASHARIQLQSQFGTVAVIDDFSVNSEGLTSTPAFGRYGVRGPVR